MSDAVEYQVIEVHDDARRHYVTGGRRPVRAHLWGSWPAGDGTRVVVLSHGTGSAAEAMSWLAEPLAAAGFLAVAVDHHGNNYVDGFAPEGFAFWWERPRDLSFVLNHLATVGGLGPVGAAGFSLGGYTAAALLGARVYPARCRALVAGQLPFTPPSEFPTLLDHLRASLSAEEFAALPTVAGGDFSDGRVRAGLLLAPALGVLLDEASLAAVRCPVAVRWGGADDVTPPAENGHRYATLIPAADGESVGADVGHCAFVGGDPGGEAVRDRVAAEAVGFFTAHLGA